jgi:cytochrome c-type biogenesis protein CcmH/NrfG
LTHTSFPATEVAGAVEAWLLQDRPKNALVAAMHAVKTDPDDGEAYIHLARALFHCDEVDAAFRALSRAKSLAKDTPAVSYLEARIRLHSAGLGSGRDEVRDPAEALSILDLLLSALEHDPAFGEAAYHAAVLALSLGLKEEGRRLLRQVAPLMEASPERARYIEDVSRLN